MTIPEPTLPREVWRALLPSSEQRVEASKDEKAKA